MLFLGILGFTPAGVMHLGLQPHSPTCLHGSDAHVERDREVKGAAPWARGPPSSSPPGSAMLGELCSLCGLQFICKMGMVSRVLNGSHETVHTS